MTQSQHGRTSGSHQANSAHQGIYPTAVAIGFLAYVVLLACYAASGRAWSLAASASVWELQESSRFFAWLLSFVWGAAWVAAAFVPVGILAQAIVRNLARPKRQISRFAVALLLCLAATFLVRSMDGQGLWSFPAGFSFVLPMIGSLGGIWFATAWRRGMVALLSHVLLAAGLLAMIVTGALFAAVQDQPLPFDAPAIGSVERREFVDLFKNAGVRVDGDLRRKRLSRSDVNKIAAWWLTLADENRKARVRLAEGRIETSLSLATPKWPGPQGFVNIHAGAKAKIKNQQASIHLDRLQIGDLAAPSWLLRPLSAFTLNSLRRDPYARRMLGCVQELQISPDEIRIDYLPEHAQDLFVNELVAHVGTSEQVTSTARLYYRHLAEAAKDFPQGDQRFVAFIRSAFSLAQDRSRRGDPVLENRAAILALGALLGHRRISDLAGGIADDDARQLAARNVGRVAVRGRRDWTRHFTISAAVTILSTEKVGDAIGLLKEELDADGGSGFSFGDLLADRAGVRFASVATRDEASARRLQQRLNGPFVVDHVFPFAADLPEGLSDAELNRRFGGVGGAKYRRLEAEMERRLDLCEALRPTTDKPSEDGEAPATSMLTGESLALSLAMASLLLALPLVTMVWRLLKDRHIALFSSWSAPSGSQRTRFGVRSGCLLLAIVFALFAFVTFIL